MTAYYVIVFILFFILGIKLFKPRRNETLERLHKESAQIRMIQLYGEDYEYSKTQQSR